MSIARVNEVIAKHDAPANAESSSDGTDGGNQVTASSGDGSASVDATTALPQTDTSPSSSTDSAAPGGEASAGALSHDELKAKLDRERYARATKREKRQILRERQKAEEARKAAEEEAARIRKEAASEREEWKKKPILERIKEEKGDARAAFEAMRDEALKAGTPEAQIEALTKAYDERMAGLEKKLAEAEEKEQQRQKDAAEQADEHQFRSDFKRGVMMDAYSGLREEYEPEQLLTFVRMLRDDSERFHAHAERLQVDLTSDDGSYNMLDILNVLARQQAEHEAGKQRRKQSAAPHASEAGQKQPPAAKQPTVNGTEVRKAGTTIGNDLAAATGGAPPDTASESPKSRLKRVIDKYG